MNNRAIQRKLMIEQLQKKVRHNKPYVMNEEQRALCNEFARLMKLEMLDVYEDDELELEGFTEEDLNIDFEAEWRKLSEKSARLFRDEA